MIDQQYIAQLQKQYTFYLRSVVAGQPFQSINLRGGKNRPNTTAELHEMVRLFQHNEKTPNKKGWSIDWEQWTSKKFGKQRWPGVIRVTTEDDFLFLISKESEVDLFKAQLDQMLNWQPVLREWLMQRPASLLEYASVWPAIRSVVDHLLANDVAHHYIRSIPVPVHTKFMERYKKVIYSLLHHLNRERFPLADADLEEALQLNKKPFLFTARWLDHELAKLLTAGMEVFAVPVDYLKQQVWKVSRVIIVENQTNLYLLPAIPGTLAICGYGLALHQLKDIGFLRQTELFYWGDMDEKGFCMLNDMRSYYDHVKSLFMDAEVLAIHNKELDANKVRYKGLPLARLTLSERTAYEHLLQHNQWLEQEKLQQAFLQTELHNAFLK